MKASEKQEQIEAMKSAITDVIDNWYAGLSGSGQSNVSRHDRAILSLGLCSMVAAGMDAIEETG